MTTNRSGSWQCAAAARLVIEQAAACRGMRRRTRAWRVLLAVLAHTAGWSKQSDQVSPRQLAEFIGLDADSAHSHVRQDLADWNGLGVLDVSVTGRSRTRVAIPQHVWNAAANPPAPPRAPLHPRQAGGAVRETLRRCARTVPPESAVASYAAVAWVVLASAGSGQALVPASRDDIAAAVGTDGRRAGRILSWASEAGLIVYVPGGGSGHLSRVGPDPAALVGHLDGAHQAALFVHNGDTRVTRPPALVVHNGDGRVTQPAPAAVHNGDTRGTQLSVVAVHNGGERVTRPPSTTVTGQPEKGDGEGPGRVTFGLPTPRSPRVPETPHARGTATQPPLMFEVAHEGDVEEQHPKQTPEPVPLSLVADSDVDAACRTFVDILERSASDKTSKISVRVNARSLKAAARPLIEAGHTPQALAARMLARNAVGIRDFASVVIAKWLPDERRSTGGAG